jgi:LuxR family quorum sensing-dependent transcriptional regulator
MIPRTQQNLVLETAYQISGLTVLSQIADVLAEVANKFGFVALGINGLPPPAQDADPHILTEYAPAGFRDLYIHERLYLIDHICAHARTAVEPFRFSEAPYDPSQSRDRQRFLAALRTFGVGEGLIVPIGRPSNEPACVWLAGSDPRLDHDAELAIQMIALFAANRARALVARPRVEAQARLSSREREVLQWTAAGKTSWEISVIAKLSESAVNKIIAEAMTRLGAVTRAQAVAKAMRLGEIEW